MSIFRSSPRYGTKPTLLHLQDFIKQWLSIQSFFLPEHLEVAITPFNRILQDVPSQYQVPIHIAKQYEPYTGTTTGYDLSSVL